MRFKNALKVALPLVTAGAAIYGAETSGLVEWGFGYEINKVAYFGDWAKNIALATRIPYHIVTDAIIGGVGAGVGYGAASIIPQRRMRRYK